MTFRTTSQTANNLAIRFAANYNSNIIGLQTNISSGTRLQRASDDPVAFRQVTSLTTRLQQIESELTSIDSAEVILNSSVTSIQQANDVIVSARSLAQQGVQTPLEDESAREALAVEVEALLASLQDISLSRFAGEYLYAGTESNAPPFEFGDPVVEGGPLVADYQGGAEGSFAFVGTSIAVETYYAGDQIFGQSNREDVLVFGNTGAANGAGTDSIVGRADLIVEHTATTYAGGSGVAPGTSSPGNDTVLGVLGANSIRIVDTSGTGAAGTVSLNGGLEFPWQQSDTDLIVTDERGRQVSLDLSGITAGFDGDVDLASDGTVSVDGGLTSVAIDFSESQTIVDSVTGGQTHIDTSGISQTGTDRLEFPQTSNVFQVFHELISDLRNTREFDSVDFAESLDRRFGELSTLSDRVLVTLGQQSASLQSLDELSNRVGDLQLQTEIQINELQATDLPEAVLNLQNQQTLLEFTYSVAARVASTSLLNFF